MKVSKQEKLQTRRKIVKTAANLFSEQGYDAVTMRTIARTAGIGDATIYNYFPSKEKLLVAYYEITAEDAVSALSEIDSFEEYSLQEKIQVLLDNYLAIMQTDREFVTQSFSLLFQSPMFLFGDTNPVRKVLYQTASQFLEQARDKDEIPSFAFQSVLPDLICEYIIGVLYFWIKDESEEFHETGQLIDMSLNLAIGILKSGVINRATDFFGFMLKSQMFRLLNPQNNAFFNMNFNNNKS